MHRKSKGVKSVLKCQPLACDPSVSWMADEQRGGPCKAAAIPLGHFSSDAVRHGLAGRSRSAYDGRPAIRAAAVCLYVTYSPPNSCAPRQGGYCFASKSWSVSRFFNAVARQMCSNHPLLSIDIPAWAYYHLTISAFFDIVRAHNTIPLQSSSPAAGISPFLTTSPTTLTSSDPTFHPSSVASALTSSTLTSSSPTVSSRSTPNGVEIVTVVVVLLILVGLIVGGFLLSRYRRRTASRSSYRPLFTHPNRELSISSASDTIVDTPVLARPSWITRIFSNRRQQGPPFSPYNLGEMSHSESVPSPPRKPLPMAVFPAASSSSLHNHPPRPTPVRMWTAPLPSSTSDIADEITPFIRPLRRHTIVESVKNVPRPSEWRIEDTPTDTRNLARETIIGRRRYPGDPEIGGSVRSMSRQTSIDSLSESDSLALLSSGSNSRARQTTESPLPGGELDSYKTNASKSLMSVAAASSELLPDPDSIRYGAADNRTKLFPRAVRAAGYTGVPSGRKYPQA